MVTKQPMRCQADDVGVPCVSNTTVVAQDRETRHLPFSTLDSKLVTVTNKHHYVCIFQPCFLSCLTFDLCFHPEIINQNINITTVLLTTS